MISQSLNVCLRLAFYSLKLVVNLGEIAAVRSWPKDDSEQVGHHQLWGKFTLGQTLIGSFFKVRSIDMYRFLPLFPMVNLLGDLQKLVLGDVNIFNIDESTLSLLWVT